MAATDQNYRNQKGLDIFFGVSCVLMLVGVVWMFWQDYSREFKVEQRDFRDVEAAVAERQMLQLVPDQKQMEEIEEAETYLREARKDRDQAAHQAYEAVKARKKGLEDAVSKNEDILKKKTADFDRFAKLAHQKEWKFG